MTVRIAKVNALAGLAANRPGPRDLRPINTVFDLDVVGREALFPTAQLLFGYCERDVHDAVSLRRGYKPPGVGIYSREPPLAKSNNTYDSPARKTAKRSQKATCSSSSTSR